MTNNTPNPTLVKEAVERIWATLHQINGHWWNKRQRPDARDLEALLTSLPTDDDDTVERVARALEEADTDGEGESLPWQDYEHMARAAIHTLIGRAP